MYYADKRQTLKSIFGARDVTVRTAELVVDGRRFPVVDDVIIALPPDQLPPRLQRRSIASPPEDGRRFSSEVQQGFGDEWSTYPDLLPEHDDEFDLYFDLIDLEELRGRRVVDLGCGIGRWAARLAPCCADIVLVDFSDAIFVARRNLAHYDNAIFILGDVLDLPFGDRAFDFAYCLGVLHHLPIDALDATRSLRPLAPRLLVYLYYALDNRPAYFRVLLSVVTAMRLGLSRIRSPRVRNAVVWFLTLTAYVPLITFGERFPQLRGRLPLHEAYSGKSVGRLRQDVYDRFFTRIEQRFSRGQILTLCDTFSSVTLSDHQPYWHFLCE